MKNKRTTCIQKQRSEADFEISPTISPEGMARRIRTAFKRMPEESALIVFAKVMTSDVPHNVKVAVWDAVRYSHIWWKVDDMLTGDMMENALIQCAFADTITMRCWRVRNRAREWQSAYFATTQAVKQFFDASDELSDAHDRRVIALLTQCRDDRIATILHRAGLFGVEPDFVDDNGNNLLWYLTYREDQCAADGFACPKTAAVLTDLGVDPNHRNKLGLCWNDVARHVNREGQCER